MTTPDAPREAAARWFARTRDGSLSEQERVEMAAWLDASPVHRAEYTALERIWQAAGALDPERLRALAPGPAPAAAARRSRPALHAAMLASLCAVAVGAAWLVRQQAAPGPATYAASDASHYTASFSTAPGERRRVTLPDGSVVELNTRTRLSVRFEPGQRTVTLADGEAMFEVAHASERPFVVDAGSGTVTVTGTRFDVRRDGAEVAVAVESGSVGVQGRSAAPSAARLSAGLGTRIAADGRVAPAAAVDLGATMAWREGKLLFKDQPLSLVAAEVSRYRRSPVRISDAGTGALRLSSVFRADDTDALLAALPQFLPVGVRTLADGSTEIYSR
ncbi:FecR family protein [Cupriavidus sp. D39]|uniref:FecR family protein n=1 Tax=Cupriavidus sp. D39 TaxID=2997877 RepID=UPI00226EB9A3|nr:FecR family protein [Cupriavidus sp. D39]MCY0854398.1 FecR family protein [Cupriavidus sp. D39]